MRRLSCQRPSRAEAQLESAVDEVRQVRIPVGQSCKLCDSNEEIRVESGPTPMRQLLEPVVHDLARLDCSVGG